MSFSLNGLASGLDTSTIISQLMQIERIPYQKLEQKQSNLNSEQSIFRTINTKLSALRSAADELSMSFGFDLRSATISDETVLRATASESVAEGDYTIDVTKLATKHSVASQGFTGLEDPFAGTLKFGISVAGVSKTFETEDVSTLDEALEQLRQKINSSELDVNATLITTNENTGAKTLVITSNKSGKVNEITITDNTNINFTDAQEAQDAEFSINGVQVTSSSNESSEIIPGLSLSLLKANETATIQVRRDVDKIVEKVDAFVRAYNDVISTVKSNTGKEKRLQGDSTMRMLESTLNNLINKQIGEISEEEGGLNFLFQIGLEVDKGKVDAASMNGTLSFDKEVFKSAFAANPDEVVKLFANYDPNDKSKAGIARQMKDSLMEWTSFGTGILAMRIEGYDSEISLLNKQMESMQVRLDLRETQMKKQFTAMETALVQLQNQQSWLISQIASMGIGI